ncbi:MAG TPA: FAD-dependent oxidoreductase [Chitinophagales bacterium]|nr:FAD-dependent oxidoreductase [Chitinophagales bacterium]
MRKNGALMPSKKISRQQFIAGGAALAAGVLIGGKLIQVALHKGIKAPVPGSIVGANSKAGHLLRGGFNFAEPGETSTIPVAIIGGGISGLSAARRLQQKGLSNFLLLELGNDTGGNSASGKNEVTEYPWGAHYLPVPDVRMKDMLQFLEECGSITGYNSEGLPEYNEFHLCAMPEERLFIHGTWQEGLLPNLGLSNEDHAQVKRFMALTDTYRNAVGPDGKDLFAIPIDDSSKGKEWAELDGISFADFLKQNKFTSPYLLWYLNYCCRDDYGSTLQTTSAWAGLHYFAGRKGNGANAKHQDVLTWPEGNKFLVNKLSNSFTPGNVKTGNVVYRVADTTDNKVEICYYNTATEKTHRLIADKVILATPQYVNKKILQVKRAIDYDKFSYTPWVVANITLNKTPASRGHSLCWDNVFYNSNSLGYVNACHQHLNAFDKRRVFTYYLPLTETEPRAERMKAYSRTHADWANLIVTDMKNAHVNFEQCLQHIDIWLWGHAMARPLPGFISGKERAAANQEIDNRLFFAHSDLSGISIFEEAFYSGIRAADKLLQGL